MKNVLKNRLCLFLILAIALTLCPKVEGMAKDTVGLKPVEISSLKAASKKYSIKKNVLTIKSGVKKIDYNVLPYDYNVYKDVTKVVIPSSVTEINDYIISSYFPSLKEYSVDKYNKKFYSSNKLLVKSNKSLFSIPSKIGNELVIGNDITNISECYSYNSEITSVTLGKNVKTITSKKNPYGLLTSLFSLKEIKVDSENKRFAAKNGVLYTKDMKTLLNYPCAKSGKSFTVGSKVTTVGYAAFIGASNLTKITVEKNVKKVDSKSFSSIGGLKKKEIIFKGKAPAIKAYAFGDNSRLTVTYPKKYKSSWKNVANKKYGAYSISWKAK